MKNYEFVYQQYLNSETFCPNYDVSNGHIVIGAGYDLSSHTQSEIISDLTKVGFDSTTARSFAEASFKTGDEAKNWVDEHPFLFISAEQHQNLFDKIIIPDYEKELQDQLSNLKNVDPDNFQNNAEVEGLNNIQKQILFDFVKKDNLANHAKLTSSVVNEKWNDTITEFEKFDDKSSFTATIEKVFNEFFNDEEAISKELEQSNQANDWVLAPQTTIDETKFGDENIIDLTIPTTYDFTYNQEIGHQGQSLVPHYPGGKSGVTIGPGYDMGNRSSEEIYEDLTAAGIDPQMVQMLMGAAHKTGEEAQAWVSLHHNIHITEDQQQVLFYSILVPEYEERVQTQLEDFLEKHPEVDPSIADWDSFSDKQKQMLFDFAYNPGLDKFPTVTNAILHEDWENVFQSFERHAGGQPLAFRNEQFYEEFLSDNLHYDYHKIIQENAVDDNPYDDYYTL